MDIKLLTIRALDCFNPSDYWGPHFTIVEQFCYVRAQGLSDFFNMFPFPNGLFLQNLCDVFDSLECLLGGFFFFFFNYFLFKILILMLYIYILIIVHKLR
jgi:hypothetical protein